MARQGRTKVSELRERIVKLGGTPKGRTVAQLLDELEDLGGGGGGVSPAELNTAVSNALDERLPGAIADAMETGGLEQDDIDDIFGEG